MAEVRRSPNIARRCLIVERHDWETGGGAQQLQFPLAIARLFFGPGDVDRRVTVRVFLDPSSAAPTFQRPIVVSREYRNGTRRTNSFPEMGSFPISFIFFQEAGTADTYDAWFERDKEIVVARLRSLAWEQGRNTQYGRGRLAVIVNGTLPKVIDTL